MLCRYTMLVQRISNPKNVTGNKVQEACEQASFTLLLSATPFVVNNIQHVYLPLKMIDVSRTAELESWARPKLSQYFSSSSGDGFHLDERVLSRCSGEDQGREESGRTVELGHAEDQRPPHLHGPRRKPSSHGVLDANRRTRCRDTTESLGICNMCVELVCSTAKSPRSCSRDSSSTGKPMLRILAEACRRYVSLLIYL